MAETLALATAVTSAPVEPPAGGAIPAVPGIRAGNRAFELTASRQFTAWLSEQKTSLAFTTYQAGKLFLLGLQPDGRLSIFNRTFERCMGLWASTERLLMSTLYQLWWLENALPPGQAHQACAF